LTTFAGEKHSARLKSEENLYTYFNSFAKSRTAVRVGIEVELLGVDKATGKALPYEGSPGIHQILCEMVKRFDYKPVMEGEHVIALKRGDTFISLEPGGQIELSAPPVSNVFQIQSQVETFLEELREIRTLFPSIEWLAYGIQPFSRLDEITWVPKTRYAIMAEYFKTHGTLSHEMMKCTATNQINFDYLSGANAMASLRTALGITSIVTALFANSSFSEGQPNGFLSRRLHIWNHTDPERTGLIADFTRPGRTFRDYLEYVLRMPMMFVMRDGKWIPVKNRNFRQFIRDGFEGLTATLGDFELHLSIAFPEARLKQYLEIRGVDGQPRQLIAAAAAFWKGILYDSETMEKAWQLVDFATEEERIQLHAAVPKEGLKAKLGTKLIFPIAAELVELSCQSLAKQKTKDESRNECRFLERIREDIIRPCKSPAETLLEKWNGEFSKNSARLIEYLSIG